MMNSLFLVVGLQRSGTTLVHQTLKLHPNISTIPHEVRVEILTKGVIEFVATSQQRKEEVQDRFNRAAFLSLTTMYNESTDVRAQGAKIALSRRDDLEALVEALRRLIPEVRLIRVHREDEVARYASLLRASQTGQWAALAGAQSRAEPSRAMTIDADAFRASALQSRLTSLRLERLTGDFPSLGIVYERDLADDPSKGLKLVQEFLELPVETLQPAIKKQAPPLEELVANVGPLRGIQREIAVMDEAECCKALIGIARPARRRNPFSRVRRAARVLLRG